MIRFPRKDARILEKLFIHSTKNFNACKYGTRLIYFVFLKQTVYEFSMSRGEKHISDQRILGNSEFILFMSSMPWQVRRCRPFFDAISYLSAAGGVFRSFWGRLLRHGLFRGFRLGGFGLLAFASHFDFQVLKALFRLL